MFHSTQNTSFWRRSSQPISWCSTEETKPNTTEVTRMWANAKRDGRPAEYRWRLCSTPQSLADACCWSAVQ